MTENYLFKFGCWERAVSDASFPTPESQDIDPLCDKHIELNVNYYCWTAGAVFIFDEQRPLISTNISGVLVCHDTSKDSLFFALLMVVFVADAGLEVAVIRAGCVASTASTMVVTSSKSGLSFRQKQSVCLWKLVNTCWHPSSTRIHASQAQSYVITGKKIERWGAYVGRRCRPAETTAPSRALTK